jgi:hypothetical protein
MTPLAGRKGGHVDRRYELGRRDLARILLTLTAAPALARTPDDARKEGEEPPSPLVDFLAAQQAGLTPPEREALKKSLKAFEKSLKAIRDFELPRDVAPCLRFAARKSRRG